ncbi:hypothetical protein GC175_20545 [bacterium]|nr:hypothetical protein [bacterium]
MLNATSIFTKKLNLKEQPAVLVLNAPPSFEPELTALEGVAVHRDGEGVAGVGFTLAFAMTQNEVDTFADVVAEKTEGDAIVWFAYPKGSSKKYKCEFNRDTGWERLGAHGFEPVRQVAIDEDWSALRFRRVQYIKTLTRSKVDALSEEGKARTSNKKQT